MKNLHNRKTKIICTIGPSTSSYEKIIELIKAGMDVARLNFSHGSHDSHQEVVDKIKKASASTGKQVGILQDLGGPKIRLGILSTDQVELKHGETVVLFSGESSSDEKIPVNYPYLKEDIHIGSRILLSDGLVELVVEKIDGINITCAVMTDGTLSSNKGVNLPLSKLRIPSFTEKDKADLTFGLSLGFDYVAMSFVRSAKDLMPARKMIDKCENPPMLFAKIEKPEAIDKLDEIMEQVEGVMVARGDLGVEMPFEKLPIVQKHIISVSRRSAKPVITATQMLRSMIDNPRPTRAEATDAANAILDGTGALMLSDETAVGKYPIEAVATLDQIAMATEPYIDFAKYLKEPDLDQDCIEASSVSRAACVLANELKAICIVCATYSGATARLVSKFRTDNLILGLTSNENTLKKLSLMWGVVPILIEHDRKPSQLAAIAKQYVLEHEIGKSGDKIILTTGFPATGEGSTNMINVVTVD